MVRAAKGKHRRPPAGCTTILREPATGCSLPEHHHATLLTNANPLVAWARSPAKSASKGQLGPYENVCAWPLFGGGIVAIISQSSGGSCTDTKRAFRLSGSDVPVDSP